MYMSNLEEEARHAQLAQQLAKPVDWNKLLQRTSVPKIKPLDFTKYEGMRVSQAAQPIIWEVQEKLNEIIQRLNRLA
jgi:hypothetical protein